MTSVTLSLLKLPFIILNVVLFLKAGKPPNPPPDKDAMKKYEADKRTDDPMSRWIWWYAPMANIMMVLVELMEVYAIISANNPSLRVASLDSLASPAGVPTSALVDRIRITKSFVVASLFIFAGASIRLACFERLGRQFTFELSVRNDHKLITDGPYAWVRHPSYTGAFMYLNAIPLSEFGSGSWFMESGAWQTPYGRLYACTIIASLLFFQLFIVARTWKEDEVLRREFKDQWNAWAKKTPYRLIPGIF